MSARMLPSADSLPRCQQQPGLDKAESRSRGLHLGFLCGWQVLLPPLPTNREAYGKLGEAGTRTGTQIWVSQEAVCPTTP